MLIPLESRSDTINKLASDFQPSPKGGRPPVSKRQALAGIFWILDNGAKWKKLPKSNGFKTSCVCASIGKKPHSHLRSPLILLALFLSCRRFWSKLQNNKIMMQNLILK
jgi:transposase